MLVVGRECQLHVCNLNCNSSTEKSANARPVVLIHGSCEDGRVFYSVGGNGLGPFLARAGFNVFIVDMRGHGRSWPRITPNSQFGFHQIVTEDLPALTNFVSKRSGGVPQSWITHASGGMLVAAFIARYGFKDGPIVKLAHFSARRQLRHHSLKRRLILGLVWRRFGQLAVKLNGYLPSTILRLGNNDESARSFYDHLNWSLSEQWLDSEDGFDYRAALKQQAFPQSLYFASAADRTWAHQEDVRWFMDELGRHDARLITVGAAAGNHKDYSQLGLLLDAEANEDHFLQLLEWLNDS